MNDADEDAIDLRELPRDITDRAIGRWHDAAREQAEACRLAEEHVEYENWTDLTTTAEIAARVFLINAILAYDPEYSGTRRRKAECRRWKPRGVRSHGKLYITAPDEDRDEGMDGIPEDLDGPIIMQLFEVDESRIIDVEWGGYIDKAEGGKLPS